MKCVRNVPSTEHSKTLRFQQIYLMLKFRNAGGMYVSTHVLTSEECTFKHRRYGATDVSTHVLIPEVRSNGRFNTRFNVRGMELRTL